MRHNSLLPIMKAKLDRETAAQVDAQTSLTSGPSRIPQLITSAPDEIAKYVFACMAFIRQPGDVVVLVVMVLFFHLVVGVDICCSRLIVERQFQRATDLVIKTVASITIIQQAQQQRGGTSATGGGGGSAATRTKKKAFQPVAEDSPETLTTLDLVALAGLADGVAKQSEILTSTLFLSLPKLVHSPVSTVQ